MESGSSSEAAARHAAYRATAYRVDDPAGAFEIRIDAHCLPLDALLDRAGAVCWAFLTAYNPGGRLRDPADNLSAQRRLAAQVALMGFETIPGRSTSADNSWPPEDGLLILAIARDAAILLARAFEQEALVVGLRGASAELVFC